MSIMDKIKKASTIKGSNLVSESKFFQKEELADTGIPALNIILSGRHDGGLGRGLTFVASPSQHYKTLIGLKMVAGYLNKYPDAVCIFYDSEYGGSLDYMKMQGVDPDRVFHSPLESIETLKFDMVSQLEAIEEGEHVIFFIDSLGMLASNKETEDTLNQKSVADMTKAKELASFARMVTPRLNTKQIPCVAINHVYKDISSMYGGSINSGGEKLRYAGNNIIHISKSKEKEGKDLVGFTFKLIANKSRFVKEGSIIPLVVTFDKGLNKWSGMFDLAVETGWITIPKQGWYMPINKKTGEMLANSNKRRKDLEDDDNFWHNMFEMGFGDDIYNQIALAGSTHIDIDDE